MQGLKGTIVAAYAHLVRRQRTAFPRITDLLRHSGVSRSTLYKHFDDRAAVLAASMQGPFAVLATTTATGAVTPQLIALLDHFWNERRNATELLASPHANRLARALADELGATIAELDQANATRIAHAQITLLRLWLSGETPCGPSEMAQELVAASTALRSALVGTDTETR